MSGGAKKQTVGYKIYLGMQAVLTHGPIDYLLRLRWDGRDAWFGRSAGGSLNIDKPGLYGDEEREGGVVGTVDFEQGAPDQGPNDYLQSQMGELIPSFRGITQLVMRKLYWGMNPYLKTFSALMQRIHVRQDGIEQWYDEKAEIPSYLRQALNLCFVIDASGSMLEPVGDSTRWQISIDQIKESLNILSDVVSSNLRIGLVLFGTTTGYPSTMFRQVSTVQDIEDLKLYLDTFVVLPDGDTNWANGMLGAQDFFTWSSDGEPVILFTTDGQPGTATLGAQEVTDNAVEIRNEIEGVLLEVFNIDLANTTYSDQLDSNGSTVVVSSSGSGELTSAVLNALSSLFISDMNPAHIIRECLTDPIWGMGYNEEDVEDESFMPAADTLFNEAFGLSILWDRQMPIEDFVKEVLRHIGASCSIGRNTGKFRLKLIRADYDIAALPVFGPDEIESVENPTMQAAGEFVNSVTVNYWDASTGNDGSVTEQDPALVQMQGVVINTTINYPMVTKNQLGSRLAFRDLQTLSVPLYGCTIYLPVQLARDLEIGDVFVMSWPEHGIAGIVMRVLGMTLGDGKKTHFRLTVSQDIYSLPLTGSVTVPDSTWEDPIAPAQPLTTRIAIEAPYHELIQRAGQATVDSQLADAPEAGYVLASAQAEGSAYNAQLWTDSGAGYQQVGIVDFSPVLTLDADVSYGDTAWTVTDVANADLLEEGMYGAIGDEFVVIVSKVGSALTVGRGVLDTVPAPHVAGEKIIFFDAYGGIDETQYADGESIDVKLLPVSGNGPLDIAGAPADTVVMASRAVRPYPPGNVKIDGVAYPAAVADAFTVTWSHRNRQAQADVILDTTQPDVAPVANTRYGLRFLDSFGALLVEQTDIGPGTADVELNYTGDVIMELYTINEDGVSLYKHSIVFAYTGTVGDTITATPYTPVDDSTIIDGGDLDG